MIDEEEKEIIVLRWFKTLKGRGESHLPSHVTLQDAGIAEFSNDVNGHSP